MFDFAVVIFGVCPCIFHAYYLILIQTSAFIIIRAEAVNDMSSLVFPPAAVNSFSITLFSLFSLRPVRPTCFSLQPRIIALSSASSFFGSP